MLPVEHSSMRIPRPSLGPSWPLLAPTGQYDERGARVDMLAVIGAISASSIPMLGAWEMHCYDIVRLCLWFTLRSAVEVQGAAMHGLPAADDE